MAELNTIVFSASIDNEDAIREWVVSLQEQAGVVQQALDDLAGLLRNQPHISIILRRSSSDEIADEAAERAGDVA